jgi:hypothetical protein
MRLRNIAQAWPERSDSRSVMASGPFLLISKTASRAYEALGHWLSELKHLLTCWRIRVE